MRKAQSATSAHFVDLVAAMVVDVVAVVVVAVVVVVEHSWTGLKKGLGRVTKISSDAVVEAVVDDATKGPCPAAAAAPSTPRFERRPEDA